MKLILTVLMLGLFVFANDSLHFACDDDIFPLPYYYYPQSSKVEANKDSIKYYQIRGDEDTLIIYSPPRFLGSRYQKWEKIIVYAETCVCEEVDVVIIKYSHDDSLNLILPRLILEERDE